VPRAADLVGPLVPPALVLPAPGTPTPVVKPDPAARKPKDGSKLRAEAESLREALERSSEMLADQLADRAREIDDKAAAHLRALEQERGSLPGELRASIAAVLPGMVADAVDVAVASRPVEAPPLGTLSDELRRSIAAALPGMVAEAVRVATAARAPERLPRTSLPDEVRRSVAGVLPSMVADAVNLALATRAAALPDPADGALPRAGHDAIIEARQRSLEKRLDGVTRRAQQIDDRVTTHLRAIDDDRAAMSDVQQRQQELAQSLTDADLTGHHNRLAVWVNETVPKIVAVAVQAPLEAQSTSMAASLDRAERVRSDVEVLGRTVQETSERVMGTLFRRDQEVDARAAAQLRILEEERSALAALLEGGRDQITESVVGALPTIVDDAVRRAMERYATERRAPALEMATRLRSDADVMRETLQRSFEKMMEALAVREQELDERVTASVRAYEHEKAELAELRSQVAGSLAESLPAMVADAVRPAEELHRADLEAARAETARLRAESEATAAELREAVAGLRAALADREESSRLQAAASERALEGLRSAMARRGSGANGRPGSLPAAPVEATVVDDAHDGPRDGPVAAGRSSVPRARRVERRMLKIDDGDDGPWRPLDRRQAALSDLLDGPPE